MAKSVEWLIEVVMGRLANKSHIENSVCTSYRHKEPEHLSPNFVWAVRHARTICHTNSSSLCSGSLCLYK